MENINLMRKLAWSFHYSTGLNFEDLLSEAYCAYYMAKKEYTPRKGKFSTWIWECIENHLINYCKQERFSPMYNFINLEDANNMLIAPESRTKDDFLEFLMSLPKDCQHVAHIATSKKFMENQMGNKQARGIIYKTLREEGWRWRRIWTAFNALKFAVNEIE